MKSRRALLFQTILMGWILHYSGYAASNRSDLTAFGILTLLFLAVSGGLSQEKENAGDPVLDFKTLSQNETGWILQLTSKPSRFNTIVIDGQQHLVFNGDQGGQESREGSPQLPSEGLGLGVPFGFLIVAEIKDPVYESISNQLVAPIPHYEVDVDGNAVPRYRKDPQAYSVDGFFPSNQVTVERPFVLRQQHISTVRFSPYQYNPATRTLKRLVQAKVQIRLVPNDKAGSPVPPVHSVIGDQPFEKMYKGLLWNYEQAKQWRTVPAQTMRAVQDPTRDWFETGRWYYRVNIANDGWYRVTTADIAAAGGNTSQIDVPSLKMFWRGAEIPIVVRPDTSVEFYGLRNAGDTTYLNFYTDTSAYWLTWGGANGLRFASTPQHPGPGLMNVVSAKVMLHEEVNSYYYFGTTQQELIDNDVVPGEGWTWGDPSQWFYPFTIKTFPFVVDTIDVVGSSAYMLRVRLFSGTLNYATPNHGAKLWVNDSLIGETFFAGRTGVTFTASFPTSWLHNGSNILKIQSTISTAPPNQFFLDWFEVDYQRYLRAKDDQLCFSSPASTGLNPATFTIAGFSNPQIEVFDLTKRRAIIGGTITGDPFIGYKIAFKDTFSTVRQYLVTCNGGPKPVPPVISKQFADIRVNATGTDYVVIAHRKFFAAAQQLAGYRQAHNGLRAKVIDVQGIYDEFNYGIFKCEPIKTFLQFAHNNWPGPAPTYLIFVGDACVDFHHYLATTTNTNYIPSYGRPASDNWFACFDSTHPYLSSMLIGRLPVVDSVQAMHTLQKLMGYDNYVLGDWSKTYLSITGGSDAGEQSLFNQQLSEPMIATYFSPPPLGGTTHRVYKTTTGIGTDRSRMQEVRGLIKQGLVFINFIGHSDGRIWNLEVGDPNGLENTNGMLPFISSVSCNVASFGSHFQNTLSEDMVLADNRGAIALWGSSSLGYANTGSNLVNFLLRGLTVDSLRDFGSLTTTARYRLYQAYGTDYITLAHVKLTPLVGDPLSKMAIPLKPDLALTASAITLERGYAANDSLSTIKVNVSNYGLVPPDSVVLRLNDTFNGQAFTIVNDQKLAPTRYADSLVVSWDASNQVGRHTFVGTMDPNNMINEVNEMNNASASDKYVYANLLSIVKPFDNMVVPPGSQTLVVTSPFGLDSVGFSYFFELDTVDTFNSPFLISSGAVPPGIVSGQWTTPSLSNDRVYFWRCRTLYGVIEGNWVTSAFSTSTDSPGAGLVRWRESARRQFARNKLTQSTATDSGVTLFKGEPVSISVRSLGARNGSQPNFFSSVSANEYRIDSYPWIWGNGFLVLKVNHLNGQYEVTGYNVPIEANAAGFMNTYISNTVPGDYLAIAAIGDARTNVSEALYVTLESLGSQMIRLAQAGQSWAMIAKKGASGPGMPVIENLTDDSVVVDFLAPLSFGVTPGTISTAGIVTPTSWSAFHWQANTPQGTDINSVFLGVRSNGVADTLCIIPKDSTNVVLDFLNVLTSGPTFKSVKLGGLLSTASEEVSPLLKDWWVDFTPPADLAVSSRTVGALDLTIQKGAQLNLPVTVYNIGFRGVDSARVVVSVFDKFNKARPIASAMLDTIAVNGTKSTTISISTTNFSRRVTLQVNVSPSKRYKDLVPDNNNAYYTFNVIGATASGIQLFADGVQLMDGDFVAARPKLVVRFPEQGEDVRRIEFFVDNKLINAPAVSATDDQLVSVQSGDDLTFMPHLSNGRHELKVRSIEANLLGNLDTLEQTVDVDVNGQMGILKLYNYPNPFSKDTYFTFVLTGDSRPEELHIRIFTIAGRRVQEIVVPQSELVIGFNRVYWDGRDADGDELGNGYYFYKVTIKGQGQTESSIQKLAKIR